MMRLEDLMTPGFRQIANMAKDTSAAIKQLTGATDKLETGERSGAAASKEFAKGLDSVDKEARQSTRSLQQLEREIDNLKRKGKLLPEGALDQLKQLNKELKQLEQQAKSIGSGGGAGGKGPSVGLGSLGGGIGGLMSVAGFAGGIGGATAGVVAGYVINSGLNYEQALAKVNATTQLPIEELRLLGKDLSTMASRNGYSPVDALLGYEKAISVTNNRDESRKMVELAIKANMAMGTPSAPLDPVISAVGYAKNQMPNMATTDILDILLASKRYGAGELPDMVNYATRLQGQASLFGMDFKQTMGLYSGFTSQARPEDAAMLFSNLMTALGKSEVRKGISKVTPVFDSEGKMLPMTQIVGGLQKSLKEMSVAKQLDFVENTMELRDVQAKQALTMLIGNVEKFDTIVKGVGNSLGELGRSADANSEILKSTQEINKFKAEMEKVGTALAEHVLPYVTSLASGTRTLFSFFTHDGRESLRLEQEQAMKTLEAQYMSGELTKKKADYKAKNYTWFGQWWDSEVSGSMDGLDDRAWQYENIRRGQQADSVDKGFRVLEPKWKDYVADSIRLAGGATVGLPTPSETTYETKLEELGNQTAAGGPRAVPVTINWTGAGVNIDQLNWTKATQDQDMDELTDKLLVALLRKLRAAQISAAQ